MSEGLLQGVAELLHQVGDYNGGASTDANVAVHQYVTVEISLLVDEFEGPLKIGRQILN